MTRLRPCACLAIMALALAACDDASSEAPPAEDAGADRGFALGDAAPTDGDLPVADGGGGLPADASIDSGGGGGAQGLPCDRNSHYGVNQPPLALTTSEVGGHTPRALRLADGWALAWLSPGEGGLLSLWFQRFGDDFAARGQPQRVGDARLPQFALLDRGADGQVIVWISGRTLEGGFDGLMIRAIDAAGALAAESVMMEGTFDAQAMAAAWVPQLQGMLVFSRGRQGEGGLFAIPISVDGPLVEAPVVLSEGASSSPAMVLGDEGTWGVAWQERGSENPSDLLFAVLDDFGMPFDPPNRRDDAGAQGDVHAAFGHGTFAVAWSKLDGFGDLKPVLTLYDTAGDVLATPPIPGPEGFGLVTDVVWLEPDTFGIAWQDNQSARVTVGMTRVNARGQVSDPLRMLSPEGHHQRALVLGGTLAAGAAFYVDDPSPPAAGGYSASAQIQRAALGPCP